MKEISLHGIFDSREEAASHARKLNSVMENDSLVYMARERDNRFVVVLIRMPEHEDSLL